MTETQQSRSEGPGPHGRWLPITGPAGCFALASVAVLLSCGEVIRASSRLPDCGLIATWAAAPNAPAAVAGLPPSKLPPRPTGTVIHHGTRSVATTAVLVEQTRRVNLSRLGGLYGP